MPNEYKNLIFTHHALDRLQDRSINYAYLANVVNDPDKKFPQSENTFKFIKTINHRKIHLVAKFLEKDQKWLVISVWVRGEEDRESVVWWLLTLPFKLMMWLIKKMFKKF